MATFYSQGSDLWSTLTNWDTNTGGGRGEQQLHLQSVVTKGMTDG